MSDIRHALLRRDPLSAAKEVLYHLDISLGSALQSSTGPTPGLEKSTVELVEEFIFHVPKDRNIQPKVRNRSIKSGLTKRSTWVVVNTIPFNLYLL